MAQALERIAQRYRAFAIDEARGVSEAYEALALGIATAPPILDFIASVPSDRRQPNLFLAAVRSVCGVPENTTHLQLLLRQEHERIRSVMLSRTTQTNEPARCSVLLPVLARLPQPLALLEVRRIRWPVPAARPLRVRLRRKADRAEHQRRPCLSLRRQRRCSVARRSSASCLAPGT